MNALELSATSFCTLSKLRRSAASVEIGKKPGLGHQKHSQWWEFDQGGTCGTDSTSIVGSKSSATNVTDAGDF